MRDKLTMTASKKAADLDISTTMRLDGGMCGPNRPSQNFYKTSEAQRISRK